MDLHRKVNRHDKTRTYIAALSTARSHLAVAVLGGKLYAIGGEDSEEEPLHSVECLDLSVPNSQWTTVWLQ